MTMLTALAAAAQRNVNGWTLGAVLLLGCVLCVVGALLVKSARWLFVIAAAVLFILVGFFGAA